MTKKKLTFEDAMAELEDVISKLESNNLSLDEMIKFYEKGMKLTKSCKQQLTDAEEQITTLVNENGKFKEIPGI
jgi:exodeoxyribonuclease VII small subunit